MTFFSHKIIPVETWYKKHNGKLKVIIEAFKTWLHYYKDCKHQVFILTNYNNLRHLIYRNNLSFKQVRELKRCQERNFGMNNCQDKANIADEALSIDFQYHAKEELSLEAKNTKILHYLQLSMAKISGYAIYNLSFFYRVLIYRTAILSQLH